MRIPLFLTIGVKSYNREPPVGFYLLHAMTCMATSHITHVCAIATIVYFSLSEGPLWGVGFHSFIWEWSQPEVVASPAFGRQLSIATFEFMQCINPEIQLQ